MNADEMIFSFARGARAAQADTSRQGNVLYLPDNAEVIVSGDIHDHRENFERLVRYADLDAHPQRHLIVQEILHGASPDYHDRCFSFQLLAQAAQLRAEYPAQFHMLLGNHEIAQVTNEEVLKNNQPMVSSTLHGLRECFGADAAAVERAMYAFILSLPLAARTSGGVWMSHSLPAERNLGQFHRDIFEETITIENLRDNAAIRALTWDRNQSAAALERLRTLLEVDVFVVGHQPQQMGAGIVHDSMIVLASEHGQGRFLHFDSGRSYEPRELFALARRIGDLV